MTKELVKIFNENYYKIRTQLSMQDIKALYKKYSPESDGHLSKILALRGISL